VNNVANALRDDTGPAHVDGDLYHAVIDMPLEEALIVAFNHLLGNKS